MPGLKPFSNDKLLFTSFTVSSSSVVHVDYAYKVQFVPKHVGDTPLIYIFTTVHLVGAIN